MPDLTREIPPGAYVTVRLKDGFTFTGEESTHPDIEKDGVLRMERRINDSEIEVFFTTSDQIACFTMIAEA